MIIKNLLYQPALLSGYDFSDLGTPEILAGLFIMLVPVIIIIVVIVAVVNNGKKQEQRREEALRAMYSRKDSQGNFRIEAIRNLKERGKPFDEYDVELEIERIRTSERELKMARRKAEYEASQVLINDDEGTESNARTKTKWIYIAAACLILAVTGGIIAFNMFKKANDKPAIEMSTSNVQENPGQMPDKQIDQMPDKQIQADRSVAIQNDIKNNKFQLAVFSYEVKYFNLAAWYVRKKLDLYRNKDFKEKIGSIQGSFKDDGSGKDEEFTMLENRIYYYLIPKIRITKVHKHDYTDCPDVFKVGDIIKQLVYEGEGYFGVLHKGEIRYAGYRHSADNPKKVDRSPYESCSPIEGNIIQDKEISIFIAKIKTVGGKVGWIKIVRDDENNVSNWDCLYHY